MKHFNIAIYGLVQGVFFRATTKAVADQLGIKGLVKNMPDGSVYVEAEGKPLPLEHFLDWCHEGPEKAKVEKVESSEGELKNYRNFEVIKHK